MASAAAAAFLTFFTRARPRPISGDADLLIARAPQTSSDLSMLGGLVVVPCAHTHPYMELTSHDLAKNQSAQTTSVGLLRGRVICLPSGSNFFVQFCKCEN